MVLENNIKEVEIVKYIRKLLVMAIIFFVFTVVIGLINVLDFADDYIYERRGIMLFHLHSGTIAWISTGIVAAFMWAYSQNRKDNEHLIKIFKPYYRFWQAVIPTYAIVILLSFHNQSYFFLPIFALLTIGGFFWGAYIAFIEKDNVDVFGVPHLSFIIGLAVAGYSGFIGFLMGLQYTLDNFFITCNAIDSHAGGMEIGYIFVVITGLIELVLHGDDLKELNPLGISQPVVLMIAGLFTSLGTLFNITLFVQMSLPFEIIGIIIFLIRIGPSFIKIDNLRHEADRYFILVTLFLLFGVGLFIFILVGYLIPGSTSPYLGELFKALNHTVLIGVASGAIFGIIASFSINNREGIIEWADVVGLALMYVGLLGFVFGFLFQFALHSAILMGVGILILITAYYKRMT